MIPKKYIKEIKEYYLIEEAIHPVTNELYKLGDNVLLIDDHIIYGSGESYYEPINTMFCVKDSEYVFCSKEIFKDSEFKRRHWASRPTGYFLNEVKRKISNEEIKKINDAKNILRNFR